MERLGDAQTLVKIELFKFIFRRPFQWDLLSNLSPCCEQMLTSIWSANLLFAIMQTVGLWTVLTNILATCHCAEWSQQNLAREGSSRIIWNDVPSSFGDYL